MAPLEPGTRRETAGAWRRTDSWGPSRPRSVSCQAIRDRRRQRMRSVSRWLMAPSTAKVERAREQQLVAQAVELFSHGGYRETSIREIAEKLGITRPLFYYYFDSKEELLWGIIGHIGYRLLEQGRPIAAV